MHGVFERRSIQAARSRPHAFSVRCSFWRKRREKERERKEHERRKLYQRVQQKKKPRFEAYDGFFRRFTTGDF